MPDFQTVSLRPMTGVFDTLSPQDEIGFGNWRLVKNMTTRSARHRQVGGGFRRLFAEDDDYNNQDLHDQLVDRLHYYESFDATANFGGGLTGYSYQYFNPSYSVPGDIIIPPASGPYCPVYLGDFPLGSYNGCPIFYPSIGYPYQLIPGLINMSAVRAHWRFDTIAATTPDAVGGLDLTNFGPTVADGLIDSSLDVIPTTSLQSTDVTFLTGNIRFGFCGWLNFNNTGGADQHILGRWGSAGSRQYRLILTSGQLRFEVSNNGTATTGITNTDTVTAGDWVFFACWHDQTADTINLRINDGATFSASHTTGVFTGGVGLYFAVGYDESTALERLDARVDSWTFFKNGFPTEQELVGIFSAGLGLDYPFSSDACNTGLPFYYTYSFLFTSCPLIYDDTIISGYPYGSRTPVYSPSGSYDYIYCGTDLMSRTGCREAVTLLSEIVTSTARKLIAGTMSRIYELNQSAGNWRILVDGLGSAGYSAAQCTCNSIRSMVATLGNYMMSTNNFDPPMIYTVGDPASTCDLNPMQPITDLIALGITRAGGVVTWKGFTFFYDITENGNREGGTVIWSDHEDPNSIIESDTSFAGRATIAIGARILNAAPIGNWLIFYTDKGIIRTTLVGGEDVFNFETVYEGGNAMKYKFSLINAGDIHIYAGESDVFVFTQFDTRPINLPWITRAAGFMFGGMTEDDATYNPINEEACDLVTGGWNESTREAYLSWPTGDAICPDVTLRMNMKFQTADLVDHGFTAFLTHFRDSRPTVGEWIEDRGICPRGSKVATGMKDGPVCDPGEVVADPPLYIRNPEEDPDLPIHPDSLCARLSGMTMDDFCEDCASKATFIMASASDFALKEARDDIYYRELLGGNPEAYGGYSCDGEYYQHTEYDSVMQEGAERYRSEDEKMINLVRYEADPLPASSPSDLVCEVGYAPTPECMTWVGIGTKPFECNTNKSAAQHAADKTRPDSGITFKPWRRGVYLSTRFRISGHGGSFSALHKQIKGWGQAENI